MLFLARCNPRLPVGVWEAVAPVGKASLAHIKVDAAVLSRNTMALGVVLPHTEVLWLPLWVRFIEVTRQEAEVEAHTRHL